MSFVAGSSCRWALKNGWNLLDQNKTTLFLAHATTILDAMHDAMRISSISTQERLMMDIIYYPFIFLLGNLTGWISMRCEDAVNEKVGRGRPGWDKIRQHEASRTLLLPTYTTFHSWSRRSTTHPFHTPDQTPNMYLVGKRMRAGLDPFHGFVFFHVNEFNSHSFSHSADGLG